MPSIWEEYRNIDMTDQGDIELIQNWRNTHSLDDLKKIVEDKEYSAISVGNFDHAALKKFDYQLEKQHCQPLLEDNNNTFLIYKPSPKKSDNDDQEGYQTEHHEIEMWVLDSQAGFENLQMLKHIHVGSEELQIIEEIAKTGEVELVVIKELLKDVSKGVLSIDELRDMLKQFHMGDEYYFDYIENESKEDYQVKYPKKENYWENGFVNGQENDCESVRENVRENGLENGQKNCHKNGHENGHENDQENGQKYDLENSHENSQENSQENVLENGHENKHMNENENRHENEHKYGHKMMEKIENKKIFDNNEKKQNKNKKYEKKKRKMERKKRKWEKKKKKKEIAQYVRSKIKVCSRMSHSGTISCGNEQGKRFGFNFVYYEEGLYCGYEICCSYLKMD